MLLRSGGHLFSKLGHLLLADSRHVREMQDIPLQSHAEDFLFFSYTTDIGVPCACGTNRHSVRIYAVDCVVKGVPGYTQKQSVVLVDC